MTDFSISQIVAALVFDSTFFGCAILILPVEINFFPDRLSTRRARVHRLNILSKEPVLSLPFPVVPNTQR